MNNRSLFTLDDLRKAPCAKLNDHLLVDAKPVKKSKRAKYNNQKVEWNGEMFDSKKEYQRWRELLILQKSGIIAQLRRQVKFVLIEKSETERQCTYIADHTWIVVASGEKVVEDVKSDATRKLSTYIMKRKLMKELHGITIKEY